MAYVKKIRAGLVPNASVQTFVGDPGTIFYDPAVGSLFLSDGINPGGVALSGTGGPANTGNWTFNTYTATTNNNIIVKAGAGNGAWASLLSNNGSNSFWVDDAGAHVTSNFIEGETTENYWTFGTDGNLTFPNGDITIGHDLYDDPAIIGAAGKSIGMIASGVGNGYEIGSSLIWVDSITEPTKIAGVTANNPLYVGAGDVGILTGDYGPDGSSNIWTFDNTGTLASPGGSFTKTTNDSLANTVATQVVWTSTQSNISGVKLTIQVECAETGGVNGTSWETQVCEAIVAMRGYNSVSNPVISVYGVTHTSVAPLMTFSVQRNPTTFLIEIVGTRTATANITFNADLRIYSVETGTND